ncbi:hypothetical protein LTR05_005934 [Lithohypha guttulata]|uniref:Uncharacterized protein n=1 Tax=Lithohypha guttulata TaxID=1690604 RepID=A0AAN7YF39_9EURO|nr:hypothetical protein LTR05_005934 [Lithohypha guttulata]
MSVAKQFGCATGFLLRRSPGIAVLSSSSRPALQLENNRNTRHLTTSNGGQPSNGGALAGLKVIDLSRVLAGPMCTQILADYGADVIKIESIGTGDDTRHFQAKGEKKAWKADIGPMSNYFAAINRNKRSLTLDLKCEEGRNVFLDLAKKSDVVVENFRTGTMEKLGIGYNVLSKINPGIILGSVTGYGASGPDSQKAGYDSIVGAEAGMMYLTGEKDARPVKPGLGVTDMSSGLFLHGAIMAALYARERTGRGQEINTSLFETQVALLINVGMSWLNLGQEAERWGTEHPALVPYGAFRTKDLYFVCGATNQKQWNKFCELLDAEYLREDPRFKTNSDRVEHREELSPIIEKIFETKTCDDWTAIFEGSGMPFAPINNMERVFAHRQTKARDMVQELVFKSAVAGSLNVIGPSVKFSENKASIRRRPPLLGEHTKEILRELGRSEAEIEEFEKSKVI